MEIRPIKEQDAAKWQELMINLENTTDMMVLEPGERPSDPEDALARIEDAQQKDGLILVALEGDLMVGYLSADRGAFRRNHHTVHVMMGIRDDFRNQSIGGKLLDYLDEWAGHSDVTRLELTVLVGNTIAVHLFKKKNYSIEGVKKNSLIVDGKSINEYYMAKLLTSPAERMAALAALLQAHMIDPPAPNTQSRQEE